MACCCTGCAGRMTFLFSSSTTALLRAGSPIFPFFLIFFSLNLIGKIPLLSPCYVVCESNYYTCFATHVLQSSILISESFICIYKANITSRFLRNLHFPRVSAHLDPFSLIWNPPRQNFLFFNFLSIMNSFSFYVCACENFTLSHVNSCKTTCISSCLSHTMEKVQIINNYGCESP